MLYTLSLPEGVAEGLAEKGYETIDVRSLPRESHKEHMVAIEAWLRGMNEGTIPSDEERRKGLELEAKIHGMLVNRSVKVEAKTEIDQETLEVLLDFGPNKHVLQNTTIQRIEHARKAALIPGIKEKK